MVKRYFKKRYTPFKKSRKFVGGYKRKSIPKFSMKKIKVMKKVAKKKEFRFAKKIKKVLHMESKAY